MGKKRNRKNDCYHEMEEFKDIFPCHPNATFEDIATCASYDGYIIVQMERVMNSAIVTYAKLEDC